MNELENKIEQILSYSGDVSHLLLQTCNLADKNKKTTLNCKIQATLRTRLSESENEEDVWNELLDLIFPDDLSDETFAYLLKREMCIMTLCHMPLRDEFLSKLTKYDDAPVYLLAQRYYLSSEYSLEQFAWFYHRYLSDREDISLHLLDIYGYTEKRNLLIYLCSRKTSFARKNELCLHMIADKIRVLTDSKEISELYHEHENDGLILAEIASNYNTSEEILKILSEVKNVRQANIIRKRSQTTLMTKKICEKK